MKKSRLSNLLIIFLTLFFPTYLISAIDGDVCSSSDITVPTMTVTNTSEFYDATISGGNSVSYYIQTSGAGTLVVSTDNGNNKIHLQSSDNGCPVGTNSGVTSLSHTGASAFDINVVVYASNNDNEELTITFIPSLPPTVSDVPDQNLTTGTVYNLDLSTYVTEPDGDTITYHLSGPYANANLSFNSSTGILNGILTTSGDFLLTFFASDKDGNSNSDDFNLSIVESNATAFDDFYLTLDNETFIEFNITKNVLDNDFGNDLNVTSWTIPPSGTFSMDNNGSFTYIPDIGFLGTVTFDYIIEDNASNTDAGTVSIQVIEDIPTFCYGYNYKQNNFDFTEDNNGSFTPRLVSDGSRTLDDINMTIYFKNTSAVRLGDVSSEVITNTLTDVSYASPSTTFFEAGPLRPSEYIFINYLLTPATTDFNSSIEVDLTLLSLNNHVLNIFDGNQDDNDIPLCSATGGSTDYDAIDGRFNVIHNDYYTYHNDPVNGTKYYNIPTQVTKRPGRFGILTFDPDNLDTLSTELNTSLATSVAVDIINADYFENMDATCNFEGSAISERVWMTLEGAYTLFDSAELEASIALNLNIDINSSAEFYQTSNANTAFRLSFSVTDDGNDDLVQLGPAEGNGYREILNFPEIVQVVGPCAQPTVYPLGSGNNFGIATRAAQACGNAGHAISPRHIQSCFECIYGFNTKTVCSRDNFAIRPEAFSLTLDDQDETTTAALPKLTSPTNIAADYNYSIEVTATNNIDNLPALGYTKTTETNQTIYIWNPTAGLICNDEDNKTADSAISFTFSDGLLTNQFTSINQVGDYILHMSDTEWTKVDSDTANMSHHDSSTYFLYNAGNIAIDCIENSSITQAVNYSASPSPFIGCNIDSNHTNSVIPSTFTNFDVRVHPYKFDVTTTMSVGMNNIALAGIPYVYMSDINNTDDENMSVHLDTDITAIGKNTIITGPWQGLSNYVDTCYAQAIDINITKTTPLNTELEHKYRFYDINMSGQNIFEVNGSIPQGVVRDANLTTTADYFTFDMNGTMRTRTILNFHRDINATANPEDINFTAFGVYDENNIFNADLSSSKTADDNGTGDINTLAIKHYYGRTHASRQRYEGPTGNANIYYEVYCFNTTNGNQCDKILLQNGTDSNRTDDIRWYINTNHNKASDGDISTLLVRERGPNNVVTEDFPSRNEAIGHITEVKLDYDEFFGYPYKTTMENNASKWLIYNRDDPTATRNYFSVEFEKVGADWSGEHNTSSTTTNTGSAKSNRRSTW